MILYEILQLHYQSSHRIISFYKYQHYLRILSFIMLDIKENAFCFKEFAFFMNKWKHYLIHVWHFFIFYFYVWSQPRTINMCFSKEICDSLLDFVQSIWFCKTKNTYFNSIIWDSFYFWPSNIHEVQKSDLEVEIFKHV